MTDFSKRRKVYKLVGESHYQPALRNTKAGSAATLTHEASNPHDANAVFASNENGQKLGYLSRADAAVLFSRLSELGSAKVHRLTGGTPDYPSIGCELWLTWCGGKADAGGEPQPRPSSLGARLIALLFRR